MIALFFEDDFLAAMVLRLVPDASIRHTNRRAEFTGLLGLAGSALVVIPDLRDSAGLSWLRDASRRFRQVSWVLLTHPKPENAMRLVELDRTVRIVWLDEIHHRLPPIIREIPGNDLLDCVVGLVAHTSGTCPELTRAMEGIAELGRVPRTVAGLSLAAGLPEPRLRYLWERDRRSGPSLKALVDWIVLASALRLRPTLGSWERVAAELGIKEETLRALSRRRTGMTPTALERLGQGAVKLQFLDWWQETLAG